MASTPSGTVAPAALPAAGVGLAPFSSVSILALLLMSAVALLAGVVAALLGRRPPPEFEDDGITYE